MGRPLPSPLPPTILPVSETLIPTHLSRRSHSLSRAAGSTREGIIRPPVEADPLQHPARPTPTPSRCTLCPHPSRRCHGQVVDVVLECTLYLSRTPAVVPDLIEGGLFEAVLPLLNALHDTQRHLIQASPSIQPPNKAALHHGAELWTPSWLRLEPRLLARLMFLLFCGDSGRQDALFITASLAVSSPRSMQLFLASRGIQANSRHFNAAD